MRKKRPIIVVTGPEKGGLAAWWFTAAAVWLQGGSPVRVHPQQPRPDVTPDGLILGGGADISPDRYGELLQEKNTAKSPDKGLFPWLVRILSALIYPVLFLLRNTISAKETGTDKARDELEFALLRDACKRNIPVLGICRGAQLINVHFGGSLHQDISGFYSEVPKVHTVWPRKTVVLNKKSTLYAVMNTAKAPVNALHYQAVNTLGDALIVTAREENGIIQGVEHPGFDYLLGVQWHPEYMPQVAEQRKIFRTLVIEAEGQKLS